jgi:cytoplasmic iron level regulating protein YaaA (DUF328/UPF0246 family)
MNAKPPQRIVLVACAAKKYAGRQPAKSLYASTLFRKSRAWAERNGDAWYILSALHGLVHPDTVIESYDLTLKKRSRRDNREWSARTVDQILKVATEGDTVVFLAGTAYREYVAVELRRAGITVEAPMEGLTIGLQLQWLTSESRPGQLPKAPSSFGQVPGSTTSAD